VLTTEQARLAEYTTMRLGGPARRFSVATSAAELVAAVAAADRDGEPLLVLGGGSNLVVADEGFPGVVVQAAAGGLAFAPRGDAVGVTAAAGHNWDEMVCRCVSEGLSGIECLSGIPGSAGATPIQNVGAYGQEVAETIAAVTTFDRLAGEVVRLGPADLRFGYRTSMFKRQAAAGAGGAGNGASAGRGAATGRFVVLDVTFALAASPLSAPVRYAELARTLGVAEGGRVPLADARGAVLELRRGKGMVLEDGDPDTRSAGSFFTNPVVAPERFAELTAGLADAAMVPHWPADGGAVKLSAAWLIEHAGFSRGFRLADDPDGARISTKHTLALTNPGGASTASVVRLATAIRDGVRDAFGVELAPEPTLVGVSL
jgi:UDP-N-acetylmuramate dehydrogenase